MEPDYRYQNRQQNFNPAPAPVQQPVEVKKKKKGCPIAVAIICLILAIGGVGFGIFEMLTANQVQCDCNCPNCDCANENSNTQAISDDDEVKRYIESMREEIIDKANKVPNKIYDTNTPWYTIDGAKTITQYTKSYGLDYEYLDDQEIKKNINAIILEKLKNDGFQLADYRYMDGENYTNGTLTCLVQDNSTIIGCSKNTWKADEENLNLIKSLIKAFKEKEGQEPTVIHAKTDNIQKSKYEEYEYIAAGVGAAAIFYRENQDSEWQFLFARQDAPICSNVSELERKILAGDKSYGMCYNEETSELEEY